jgi:undecaprenyl-diphosphatase
MWSDVNEHLFRLINDLSGVRLVDDGMRLAAQRLIYVSFAVLALLLLRLVRTRSWTTLVAVLASLAMTFLVGLLGSGVHPEARPFQTHAVHQLLAHAGGQSFPSDHATAAFGIAVSLFLFVSRRWGAVLGGLALLIGFARVYVGIHYPLDIAGGLAAALLGSGLVWLVVKGRAASRGDDLEPAPA